MPKRTAGRPRLPKGKALSERLQVLLSPEQLTAIRKAAEREQRNVSDWARLVLVRAAGE